MNNKELWIKWGLSPWIKERKNYLIRSFVNNSSGLMLCITHYFRDDDNPGELLLSFKEPVIFYQRTRVEFCEKLKNDAYVAYPDACAQLTFFKVINSRLVAHVQNNSQRANPNVALIHFAITEADSIVHIVVTHEPAIEWVSCE